jgi:hypothetical protein
VADELFRLTAEELTRRYRTGELSPVEVIRSVLLRIDAVNPKINALYFIDADRALRKTNSPTVLWSTTERSWQKALVSAPAFTPTPTQSAAVRVNLTNPMIAMRLRAQRTMR